MTKFRKLALEEIQKLVRNEYLKEGNSSAWEKISSENGQPYQNFSDMKNDLKDKQDEYVSMKNYLLYLFNKL